MTQPPIISDDDHRFYILDYQNQLHEKSNELAIAHQKSLELSGINNELQQQLAEQYATIQTLHTNHTDSHAKIGLLEAENEEYQRIINQTTDKYEETLHELDVTKEHLLNATEQIQENQQTMQSLNHDLLHIAKNNTPIKVTRNGVDSHHHSNGYHIDYKQKYEKQQQIYDELLREFDKYRANEELIIEQHIELDNMRKDIAKMEQRNKELSDQIIELTYNNVHLEKEINEYSVQIDQQNEVIQYLQAETLIDTETNVNLTTPKKNIRQKQLYSPTFTAINTASNHIDDNDKYIKESPEESDLFMILQSYDNNDEYLIDTQMEEKHIEEDHIALDLNKHHWNKSDKCDALEEFLHLTASAIKINYPTVDCAINELLDMVRNVPFYEAYQHLDKYMMDKVLQSDDGMDDVSSGKRMTRLFKHILHKRDSKLKGVGKAKEKKVNVPKRRTIIRIQRPDKVQKSIIDYDKLEKNLRIHEEKLKCGDVIETVPNGDSDNSNEKKKKKKRIKLRRPSITRSQKKKNNDGNRRNKKNKKINNKTDT